jgi:hypothetical protein
VTDLLAPAWAPLAIAWTLGIAEFRTAVERPLTAAGVDLRLALVVVDFLAIGDTPFVFWQYAL